MTAPWGPTTLSGSFKAFYENFGSLEREAFVQQFHDTAFLMTRANTDPSTWARALLVKIQKRPPIPGKIQIGDAAPDDPASLIAASQIIVGRTIENDVVLSFPSVSRRHAYFALRDKHWYVGDTGSANGTVLDGQPLKAHKSVRIAGAVARIEFGPDASFLFFTNEGLHEFIEQIHASQGKAKAAVPAPFEPGIAALTGDFKGLATAPAPSDEEISRVISRSAGKGATSTTRREDLIDTRTEEMGKGDRPFEAAMRALLALADLVERVEVELTLYGQIIVVFKKGSARGTPAETSATLDGVPAHLIALRPLKKTVRVFSTVGPSPIELFRAKAPDEPSPETTA